MAEGETSSKIVPYRFEPVSVSNYSDPDISSSDVNHMTILLKVFSLDYANGTITFANNKQLENYICRLGCNH